METIAIYAKYIVVGRNPVIDNFVKKYQIEYKNKYPPDDPEERKDLHHQR